MTTDIKELLPCPFCGGNASQPEQCAGTGRPVWEIGCRTSFCFTMRRSSKKDAIASWNTRTPVEQLSAQTAEPIDYYLPATRTKPAQQFTMRVVPDVQIATLAAEAGLPFGPDNSAALKRFSLSLSAAAIAANATLASPIIQTEQSSLSDAQIEEIASWLDEASSDVESWGAYASDYFQDKWDLTGAVQFYKTCAAAVRGMTAQRQDSNKDAERYRKAIAYEDNAGLLYCAVMNHCPDKAAIDAEFDAEAIDIAIANGAPVDKG